MGKGSRIRINLVRKRFNFRNYKIKKNVVFTISAITLTFLIAILIGNINHDKTKILELESKADNSQTTISKNEDGINEEETINNNLVSKLNDKNITFTILGEIMMGGDVTLSTKYSYNSAFKNIYTYTRSSDFTYATFSTNITILDEIKNARSKYLVTKDIQNIFISLGLDAVNVATDHIIDYPKSIFDSSLNLIKEADVYIAGLKDSIMYLEKDSKKIAVISANNVFIGNKTNYTDYGINVYEQNKMKNDIQTAKENADFVIVDVHWGREYIFGVTREMKSIAYAAIDSGADLVMGTHAQGIYPIVKYKEVPIIYSTGYFMTDSESEISKQSYIFDILINEKNKIETMEMTPIYINEKKEVLLYNEYNPQKSNLFNMQMNKWNTENSLKSKIIDNKIVIDFK